MTHFPPKRFPPLFLSLLSRRNVPRAPVCRGGRRWRMNQVMFNKEKPCRRSKQYIKAKLLEFEQCKFLNFSVFLEQSHFVWKTCARRNLPVASRTLTLFSSTLNDLSELRQVSRPCFVFKFAQQAKCVATSCGMVACR